MHTYKCPIICSMNFLVQYLDWSIRIHNHNLGSMYLNDYPRLRSFFQSWAYFHPAVVLNLPKHNWTYQISWQYPFPLTKEQFDSSEINFVFHLSKLGHRVVLTQVNWKLVQREGHSTKKRYRKLGTQTVLEYEANLHWTWDINDTSDIMWRLLKRNILKIG